MQSKLRFAPSPTGNLHIGSVRTAIFNWVWAKKLKAKLVLRIEDTDLERSKKEFEDNINEGLSWLGIHFDEGPGQALSGQKYRQSERIKANVYQPYLDKLINTGHAYYCFESDEELAAERAEAEKKGVPYIYSRRSLMYTPEEVAQKRAANMPYTIRFKVPNSKQITLNDEIRGNIEFDSNLFSDFIIVKSDGYPTYNFAVVVDDYEMGITHVVRGEDHISNTPKQIMIYNALEWEAPRFAHLPIILGEDRSKLSKRHGAKSVSEYKDAGFLPHALINYLSLLGWSPPEGKELLAIDELMELFEINRINKAGAVFDTVKLTWMNKQYLSKLDDEAFLSWVKPFLSKSNQELDALDLKILSVRDNVEVLSRINHYLEVFTLTTTAFFERFKQLAVNETDQLVIHHARKYLLDLSEWSNETVSDLIQHLMTELSLGKGKVMKPLRKSFTGYESGPNLVDCLALIPKSEILKRLDLVISYVST
ncbi:MAG: glutamate--tRNA ligase [Candidatus Margulisiibacteriota bacterium]